MLMRKDVIEFLCWLNQDVTAVSLVKVSNVILNYVNLVRIVYNWTSRLIFSLLANIFTFNLVKSPGDIFEKFLEADCL